MAFRVYAGTRPAREALLYDSSEDREPVRPAFTVADTLVARGEVLGRDVSDEVTAVAEVEDAAALADTAAGEVDR